MKFNLYLILTILFRTRVSAHISFYQMEINHGIQILHKSSFNITRDQNQPVNCSDEARG